MCDTSNKCDTSVARATRATRMKKFDFDNGARENIFSHSSFSYMANQRLQGEVEFHSKNYLLRNASFLAPQKLDFVIAKAISKVIRQIKAGNGLARSHIVTNSRAALLSIKTFLCETNNILFSKNY